jgi:hypothetical protein
MNVRVLWVYLTVAFLFAASPLRAQQENSVTTGSQSMSVSTPAPSSDSVVPRLIQFSGVVKDSTGKVVTGTAALTFSLYQLPDGGTPLWSETQEVVADEQGHYTVNLGANSPGGLPLDLFTSGQARWLGVQPELPGAGELPRVVLVGVPYALKAADAETLGGKPASAYVTSEVEGSSSQPTQKGGSGAPNITGGGTPGFLADWTTTTNLGNSVVFQRSGSLGVGTQAPGAKLDVNGTGKFHGLVTFASGQTFPGTASLGSNAFLGNQSVTGSLTLTGTLNNALIVVNGGGGNTATAQGATIAGGWASSVTDMGGSVGGGESNTAGFFATVGGGQINAATGFYATVGGGESNAANGADATVAGGFGNAAVTNTDTVGGGILNTANGNDGSATVGGGDGNTASNGGATIAGGDNNTAGGNVATVGGGFFNVASGKRATVAGGGSSDGTSATGNQATDDYSTVGGGTQNRAGNSGGTQFATVAGGSNNVASGSAATVSGGQFNIAQGLGSFAAGQYAQALHDGAFVWGDDSTSNPVASAGTNQFVARAAGGFVFYTASNLSTGATLASGSGSWSSLSDRGVKANFTSVDGQYVLARLAAIPIVTWNYKAQPPSIRHMGPMA